MWKKDLTPTNRILLLIAQLIILSLCVLSVMYIYTSNIRPDLIATTSYQPTSCLLVTKKLNTKGYVLHMYRADFLINYTVNGVQYNRWVSGNGLDTGFSTDKSRKDSRLAQFDFGGTYPCWYNPNDPQYAFLVARHNWNSALPILVPGLVGLFAVYYLLKNFLLIFGGNAHRVEQRPDKRK